MEHFNTVSVPYKDFSRFKKGDKELPIFGGYGMLAARWGYLSQGNGKHYATGGDHFMMFVKYNKEGVESLESIVTFGASNNPDSPHYNDQMELYTAGKAKSLTLNKETIYKEAEKVYHPVAKP